MSGKLGDGAGVMGGGGAPPGVKTEPMGRFASSPVTNGTLLPIEGFVFEGLTPAQAKAVKISLLNYAHDAATRQAQAYGEILAAINT